MNVMAIGTQRFTPESLSYPSSAMCPLQMDTSTRSMLTNTVLFHVTVDELPKYVYTSFK